MEPTFGVYFAIALVGSVVLFALTMATPVRHLLHSFSRNSFATIGILGVFFLLFWPGSSTEVHKQGDSLDLIRILRVVFFLTLSAWCTFYLYRFRAWPRDTRLHWYVLYIAVCAFSVFYSPNRLETLWKTFELVGLVLFAVVLRNKISKQQLGTGFLMEMFSYLFFGICVFSMVGWLMFPDFAYAISEDGVELNKDSAWGIFPRVNPNMLSQIGAMTAYVGFAYAMVRRRFGLRDLIFIIVGCAVLVMAHSRTSFLALALAVLLMPVLLGNKRILLIAITGFVLLVISSGSLLIEYLSRGQSQDQILSLTGRVYMWAIAWKSFLAHLWLGLGFYAGHKTLTMEGVMMAYSTVDNTYLESLVDVGLIGTFFLVSFMALTVAGCARMTRTCKVRGATELLTSIVSTGMIFIVLLRSFLGPSIQFFHVNALLVLMIVLVIEDYAQGLRETKVALQPDLPDGFALKSG
ncbi:MAG: O-antigen ligase family protein [Steroidobacteraceae bacterium]